MNRFTLSVNSRKTAMHALVVLTVLAALAVMLSVRTFAASAPRASAQVKAPGGAYLRKSSTTASARVAILKDNTSLKVYREVYKSKTSTAKKKRWYYVKTSDGTKGYIRADLVDHVKYSMVKATVKNQANIRKGPGIKMKKTGNLKKGKKITVYLDARPVKSAKGSSKVWYRIYYKGKYSFICSSHVELGAAVSTTSTAKPSRNEVDSVVDTTSNAISKMTKAQFENYLTNQGFPEAYKKSLRTLHEQHPNWVFVAYNTGLNWTDVMKKETKYGVSLIHKSYPTRYRSTSKNSFSSYKMSAFEAADNSSAAEDQAADEATDLALASNELIVLCALFSSSVFVNASIRRGRVRFEGLTSTCIALRYSSLLDTAMYSKPRS